MPISLTETAQEFSKSGLPIVNPQWYKLRNLCARLAIKKIIIICGQPNQQRYQEEFSKRAHGGKSKSLNYQQGSWNLKGSLWALEVVVSLPV